MQVAIFGRTISPVFHESLKRLLQIMHLHHVEITVYKPFLEYMRSELDLDPGNLNYFTYHNELRGVDFFFSIGGVENNAVARL